MNILGINCFAHDTAGALVQDGRVVAFVEEERFNRDKHTKAFPDQAVAYCLAEGGIGMGDVDLLAFAHRAGADFRRGAWDALKRAAPKRLAAQTYVDLGLIRKQRAFVRRHGYRGAVLNVGHHAAHAASAYFASPFEDAAVLTLDRGGDFLSTTLGQGRGRRLRTLGEVRNPDSLGEVYTALTQYLGFHPNADEGKVMGLAPYGRDRYVPRFRDLLTLTGDGRFRVNLSWFAYQREGRVPWGRRFEERYGPPRVPESDLTEHHEDLAYALQAITEEAGLHVARALHTATGSPNLVLAGGVALNSVMNARLLHETLGRERSYEMRHAFLGPAYGEHEHKEVLAARKLPFREVADPEAEAARLLSDGKIVGWFQGRAEVGPRALGARSILADPRRPEMKDIVNAQVKHREGFRPFAPAVLDERGAEYFEGYATNPFMLLVLPIRPEKRDVIPAVTHVDGTGRLQSVEREGNPSFHRLIEEFDRLTGVPVVLNTSFNLRGEPIVHRPEEALADYLNTGMDALLLGPYLLEKAPPDR